MIRIILSMIEWLFESGSNPLENEMFGIDQAMRERKSILSL